MHLHFLGQIPQDRNTDLDTNYFPESVCGENLPRSSSKPFMKEDAPCSTVPSEGLSLSACDTDQTEKMKEASYRLSQAEQHKHGDTGT